MKDIQVHRKEFKEDPKRIMDMMEKFGRVVLLDDAGKPVAAISRPMDKREVHLE